jgi:hypothetical protein
MKHPSTDADDVDVFMIKLMSLAVLAVPNIKSLTFYVGARLQYHMCCACDGCTRNM